MTNPVKPFREFSIKKPNNIRQKSSKQENEEVKISSSYAQKLKKRFEPICRQISEEEIPNFVNEVGKKD